MVGSHRRGGSTAPALILQLEDEELADDPLDPVKLFHPDACARVPWDRAPGERRHVRGSAAS